MSDTTTVAEPSEPGALARPVSPLRRALVWVTIVGVVAAGTLGLAASDLVPPSTGGGRAARFVPADGSASLSTAADGTRSIHETARDTGPGLLLELPAHAASGFFTEYDESTLRGIQLWRETVSYLDQPDPQISTLYLLDDAGVSMLSVTGGPVGFAYSPALVMLPADAAPGVRWTGEGAAMPAGLLEYSMEGELAAADAGCLLATTRTRYTDPSSGEELLALDETATWCPGRGIVDDAGVVNGSEVRFTSEELPAVGGTGRAGLRVEPAGADWSDAADWRARDLGFTLSDPAFGESPQGTPFDGIAASTGDGTLVAAMGSRLAAYAVDGAAATRTWVASPGGDLLTLSAVGDVTLVSTAERRLLAYDERGARLWAVEFPDVVLAAPTPAPDGDIVAVSLDGTLRRLDLATGAELWSAALRTDVESAVAVGEGIAVVVDRGGAIMARSLADGSARWATELYGAARAAAGDGVVAVQGITSDVWALDPADGSVRWDARHRGVGRGVVVMAGLVVSQTDEMTTAWTAGGGTERWSSTATEAMLVDGARFTLVGRSGLEVRTPDGGVVGEAELGEAFIGVSRVVLPTPHGIRVLQSNTTGMEVGG
ncbi:MAG: PQQ-binding-like beta-propeller repeat protein [Micrococcales bacterium]|nr:PQQ-binding-like beta-propeller repeat protein [Micrococcales bacterium]OJX67534.1 MAG: hypothetical protein BGO94_01545 [Micrococcales bacterium 72-143]